MNYFDKEAGAAMKTAFEDAVLDWPAVTATTMFGCPSYQADGTLFAVLVTDGVALTRLDNDHREQVAQTFDTGPFQAGERTVTKWVQVTIDDVDTLDTLVPHIKASYESALEESN
ncbi:TfoX/Sxy family protein [Halorubrum sp. HHNYT27]|uniref:TfoX/Sxy family protein n=1 Tax=Halorubrum sp. HHNYT27 TaxID=3402275 RepID=UPI003EBE7BF9